MKENKLIDLLPKKINLLIWNKCRKCRTIGTPLDETRRQIDGSPHVIVAPIKIKLIVRSGVFQSASTLQE